MVHALLLPLSAWSAKNAYVNPCTILMWSHQIFPPASTPIFRKLKKYKTKKPTAMTAVIFPSNIMWFILKANHVR